MKDQALSLEEVKQLVPPGPYEHFKGGKYEVIYVGRVEANLEIVIIYRALKTGEIWTRPAQQFMESVEVDGQRVRRFQLVQGTRD